jgi:adenylate kinase family enzyme
MQPLSIGPLPNKLIIFTGSSVGSGKSTLASFVFTQLRLNGISARRIHEDDVLYLDVFAPFIQRIPEVGFDLNELLLVSKHLVEQCAASAEIYITDSIFPYFYWLFPAGYSRDTIQQFSRDLYDILEKLNPLLIYLDSDVDLALKRAVSERGRQWLEDFIPYMNTWTRYRDQPVYDIEGVIHHYIEQNKFSLELLSKWPCDKLIITTTSSSIEESKATILKRLSLSEIKQPHIISREILDSYTGTYESIATSAPVPSLEVRLAGDELFVNTYWPNGCRLVPETSWRFNLHGTNCYIEFDNGSNRGISRLIYMHGGKEHLYQKE